MLTWDRELACHVPARVSSNQEAKGTGVSPLLRKLGFRRQLGRRFSVALIMLLHYAVAWVEHCLQEAARREPASVRCPSCCCCCCCHCCHWCCVCCYICCCWSAFCRSVHCNGGSRSKC